MGSYINDRGYDSETRGGKITKVTRPVVLGRTLNSIACKISEKKSDERRLERLVSQGNGKFTMDGSNDRVNGSGYRGNDVASYPTKEDRQSYYYGYTVHGGRRLMHVVEVLIQQGNYDEIALIAERDYNNGLNEEDLGMVANIPVYLDAYRKIANRNKIK